MITATLDHIIISQRITSLRTELVQRGLNGLIVPRADEHQSEYVAEQSERLAWLTGFTGSAGSAVVLLDTAAIFVDGRYTIQVQKQTNTEFLIPHHVSKTPPWRWVSENLQTEDKLGYDPWLHTEQEIEHFRLVCKRIGAYLVCCTDNPIDKVWHDRPPPPLGPIVPHNLEFSGEPSSNKREILRANLADEDCDAILLTMPDSIAWLLNIRGADVPNTPLPLSFVIFYADSRADIFVDQRKITPGLEQHLGNEVSIREPQELDIAIQKLGGVNATVQVDDKTAAVWILEHLTKSGATIHRKQDPCTIMKSRKNPIEIEGMRQAHIRDGVAVTRFLSWLNHKAISGDVDELLASQMLLKFRSQNKYFQGPSFDTIVGSGPNGAIVHYVATAATNRRLEPGTLFLVDSGAQYLDGTTDVTRTIAVGKPSREQCERFTRVLKAHIALATCQFPKGTTGSQLDSIARSQLWRAGLDYDHGTGHGVGSYLSVHEGPQRISKTSSNVALEPGMILSNEPGYYKTGSYGIRIENLIHVTSVGRPQDSDLEFLNFETLTQAPIDRSLIDLTLMDDDEITWVNSYHANVHNNLLSLLDSDTADWLIKETSPIAR